MSASYLPPLPGWLHSRWLLWGGAAAILIAGALWQIAAPNGDLYQYRCFAIAFWRGSHGAVGIPQCAARLPAYPFPPLHVLPREYPPLALIPFTLPLLLGGWANMTLYVLAFNALMLAALAATALLLRCMLPNSAAAPLFVVWTALGATTIALVRYDALPALLVVAALALAWRAPARGAYALLALDTLLKLYPALILVALAAWDSWRTRGTPQRWWWVQGIAIASAVGLGIQFVANAISGQTGIAWLGIQGARPPQIESTAAGLVWLLAVLAGRGGQIHAESIQRSLAFTEPVGHPLAQVTLVVALGAIAWGGWRIVTGHGAPWANMAGMLLALLAGAAIFSPQYLIWATPLVALAYVDLPTSRPFVVTWTVAGILTTIIYSVGYLEAWPARPGGWLAVFMILVLARDALVWWSAWLLLHTPDAHSQATALMDGE